MTRHLAVVASRMLLMNAESLISLPDKQQLLHSHCRKPSCQDQLCQQALLSLKQEVLADKTSNLCILGLDISTYDFKDASQLGHPRGHAYRAGHPIARVASPVQAILAWQMPEGSPSLQLCFLLGFVCFTKYSQTEVKVSSEKVGFKSAQCLRQENVFQARFVCKCLNGLSFSHVLCLHWILECNMGWVNTIIVVYRFMKIKRQQVKQVRLH